MIVRLHLEGATALLMHNIRLADPLDPHTVELARLTAKRKKTVEDIRDVSNAEFVGSLYHDHTIGPYVPAEWLRKAIIEGARLSRSGKQVERGLNFNPTEMEFPVLYRGHRDLASLVADESFHSRLAVGVMGKRVMRTRPKFTGWKLEASFDLYPDVLDPKDLGEYASTTGRLIGIGDGRSVGYGRFHVSDVEIVGR